MSANDPKRTSLDSEGIAKIVSWTARGKKHKAPLGFRQAGRCEERVFYLTRFQVASAIPPIVGTMRHFNSSAVREVIVIFRSVPFKFE